MGTDVVAVNDTLVGQGEEPEAATIYEDNESTITMIHKGKSSAGRSKHINVRYYWLSGKIESNEINVVHMPTEEMIADVLTKPLQGQKFKYL